MTYHILERNLRQKQKGKQTVPFFTQLQFLKPLFLQEQEKNNQYLLPAIWELNGFNGVPIPTIQDQANKRFRLILAIFIQLDNRDH